MLNLADDLTWIMKYQSVSKQLSVTRLKGKYITNTCLKNCLTPCESISVNFRDGIEEYNI